jgi:hypothetical protein
MTTDDTFRAALARARRRSPQAERLLARPSRIAQEAAEPAGGPDTGPVDTYAPGDFRALLRRKLATSRLQVRADEGGRPRFTE